MKKAKPIANKNEVAESTDNKIDQDFPGFPHGTAAEEVIHPTTATEKKVASVNHTDGEKVNKKEKDESNSDGSAGAFKTTENSSEEDE